MVGWGAFLSKSSRFLVRENNASPHWASIPYSITFFRYWSINAGVPLTDELYKVVFGGLPNAI